MKSLLEQVARIPDDNSQSKILLRGAVAIQVDNAYGYLSEKGMGFVEVTENDRASLLQAFLTEFRRVNLTKVSSKMIVGLPVAKEKTIWT